MLKLTAGLTGSLMTASAVEAHVRSSALVPSGAVPSARQRDWHRRLNYAFVHFTVNTFTDREWGYGDEAEAVFNPTDFSADQIVQAVKAGGLTGLILTAKHHDGFCLWPTAYTEHSIKNSPYKDGKGDIVGEMAEACRRHDLPFGVYLSPWDRNHADYGQPSYVTCYHNQLTELLSHYGKLFEVWFDGANGGDGYYGGAREVRKIDGATYYQWDKVRAIVRDLQPDAVTFGDSGMDLRWVGNEDGVAGDPCWPTMDTGPYTQEKGNAGVRGGPLWNPAEADVSIRPGWFWHSDETPRSPANLIRLYLESVGRGSSLLLNIPPDRRGRIPDADIASLKAWRALLDATFAHNLAAGARVTASSSASPAYAPKNALKPDAAWAAAANDRAGAWVSFDLPAPVSFNIIRLAENLTLGARTDTFAVDIWQEDAWSAIARHTCISNMRLIALDAPVSTTRVRVRIISATASPTIGNFGLFHMPEILEEPGIGRDRNGLLTLKAPRPGIDVHYTTDGTMPTPASPLYTAPEPFVDGGEVKAIAVDGKTGVASEAVSERFDVSPRDWHIVSATGDTPQAILAGGVFSGPHGQPVEIVIDLGRDYDLKGFTLVPFRPDIHMPVSQTSITGSPAGYTAWVGEDGQTWGPPAGSGEFANIAASRAEQKIRFASSHKGRYLRLVLPKAVLDRPIIALSGVGILTR
jgi:alpha-L-fucosidase